MAVISEQLDRELRTCKRPPIIDHIKRYGGNSEISRYNRTIAEAFPNYPAAFHADLADALVRDRIARHNGSNGLVLNNDGRRLFSGIWWEFYIQTKIKDALSALSAAGALRSLKTNLEVVWDGPQNNRNEIDLAFVENSHLFLVPCATGNTNDTEKHRFQIERFADQLGGSLARPMLACTLPTPAFRQLEARKSPRLAMPAVSHWKDPAIPQGGRFAFVKCFIY